jgi:integrase/recombinase XerD
MKRNSLSQDSEGDWYLKRVNLKYRKEHTVPISAELKSIIDKQVSYVDEVCSKFKVSNLSDNLFGHPQQGKFKSYTTRNLNNILKAIAKKINLTDELGMQQNLSSHMFRHTVGTNLVNSGVDLLTVQNFLGHETPLMTAIYAQLHNKTMRAAISKAQKQLVDIKGNLYSGVEFIREVEAINDEDVIEAKWLKRQLATQALPNGICALPVKQTCPHANACLTCSSFRTDKSFIDVHHEQLRKAQFLTKQSKAKQYIRQYDLNIQVENNLKTIIKSLETIDG